MTKPERTSGFGGVVAGTLAAFAVIVLAAAAIGGFIGDGDRVEPTPAPQQQQPPPPSPTP